MKVDFEKVGIIVAYFADNTKELYVTKLLKLFYYLDFISYKIHGSSVSNDIYLKLPYGPVPSAIKSEIDVLSTKDVLGKDVGSQLSPYIKLIGGKDGNGNIVISVGKELNIKKKLSVSEFNLVKHITEVFKNTKAKTLTNQTHREKPWLSTSLNSVIDYKLAEELDVSKILPSFRKT